ncbi:MAG: nitroreductase family protein [Bdellovibrionales bacterium]|nr:nitroreductase family protein [Bdellovibrionales bacterium]
MKTLKKTLFDNERGLEIARQLLHLFRKRRSTRHFHKSDPLDIKIIENAVAIAATAPSGANKQPWTFSIIQDEATKAKIRKWAEQEETQFYQDRQQQRWLNDLKPLRTTPEKSFLTEANYLIAIFSKPYNEEESLGKSPNYYVKESVGIATGMLLAALHLSGLSTLTYTPSNRRYLSQLLNRQRNEVPFMIVAVGMSEDTTFHPQLSKKTLDEILDTYKGIQERPEYSRKDAEQ